MEVMMSISPLSSSRSSDSSESESKSTTEEEKTTTLGKKKIGESSISVEAAPLIKRVRTTNGEVHVTFKIPDGINQGKFQLEVNIGQPETSIAFPIEYANKPTDTTLYFDHNRTISVHREVLKKNPYFKCLLDPNFKEGNESKIKLVDVTIEEAKPILQYFYSDEFEVTFENYLTISHLVDLWLISELKEKLDEVRKEMKKLLISGDWGEFIRLEAYHEMFVNYLAANAFKTLRNDGIRLLPEELFEKVLNHPNFNPSYEEFVFIGIANWLEAHLPANKTLRQQFTEGCIGRKKIMDYIDFKKFDEETMIKVVGKYDIFTLAEAKRLIKMDRYSMRMNWRWNPSLPFISKMPTYRTVETQGLRDYFKFPLVHTMKIKKTNGARQEVEDKCFGADEIEYKFYSKVENEQLVLDVEPVKDTSPSTSLKMTCTLLNHHDINESQIVKKESTLPESFELFSTEDHWSEEEGWTKDGYLHIQLLIEKQVD